MNCYNLFNEVCNHGRKINNIYEYFFWYFYPKIAKSKHKR